MHVLVLHGILHKKIRLRFENLKRINYYYYFGNWCFLGFGIFLASHDLAGYNVTASVYLFTAIVGLIPFY